MKNLLIFSLLVILALDSCEAFPRIERQSEYEYEEDELAEIKRRQAQDDELSPEEVREDVDKLMTAVHNEEEAVGHTLDRKEMEHLGEKMERLPWYRRFGRWLVRHWEQLKGSLQETSSLHEPIAAVAKFVVARAGAGSSA